MWQVIGLVCIVLWLLFAFAYFCGWLWVVASDIADALEDNARAKRNAKREAYYYARKRR